MSKYYVNITNSLELSRSSGSDVLISPEFYILASKIIGNCNYLQSLIQKIIYTSHGSELSKVKSDLNSFPNPKARFDFLCSFPYTIEDDVVSKVFEFSRCLFKEIYELRNIISHEMWSSSKDYPEMVLFSSLEENSRLLMASGKLWHREDVTSQEVHNSIVRFISKVKLVNIENLESAIKDISICSWSLMIIDNVLEQTDPIRKEEARKPFFTFKGTSHLFDESLISTREVEFSSSKNKDINV